MILSGDESDSELMYKHMIEYISDGSQSHPSMNRREVHYKSLRNLINNMLKYFV